MFVRVYDNLSDIYFKSEVYAVINPGWYEKRLVIVPSNDGDYFKFFDYLDKQNPQAPKALINLILPRGFSDKFESVYQRTSNVNENIAYYAELLDKDIRFFAYNGYRWIYEDKAFLSKLLKGERISTKDYQNRIIDYKQVGWRYIETQSDADFLLEQAHSFHDTVLKDLNYISGAYIDNKNHMYPIDSKRQVIMRFDSQWCRSIELIFEGVTALNLRPALDNYDSSIYGASLLCQNSSVFFCDTQMNSIDKTYEGTWIESYSLRWRFCD